MPAGLEVDVPELDAPPPRLVRPATAGGDGPDQALLVEEQRRAPGPAPAPAAQPRSAALTTTIAISRTRAPGMTRRR